MNKLQVADVLQAAHDKYFGLLMKSYPTIPSDELFADFGTPELCELALEVQSCVTALGSTAMKRFIHIGLDALYPFDNPVDLYNWRQHVRNNRIDHTTYASIAIRIDSEIKRLRRTLELGDEAAYNALPPETFLVSKDRYASVATPQASPNPPPAIPPTASVHTEMPDITNPVDSPAISKLEELEKKTTIWSNVSNIITALRTLLGG
jgi:hypothetical protein